MSDEGNDGFFDPEELDEILADMEPGGFHAIPHGDIFDHVESPACPCQPKLIYRNVREIKEVWAHKFLRDHPQ